MSSPSLSWEQYQALSPDRRRRPLNAAEYRTLTREQRIAAGLEDDDEAAPADFAGRVFPNPEHIRPQLDTDPSMPVTRLPEGAAFDRGTFRGSPQFDISNGKPADVIPTAGRLIASQMGTPQAMKLPPGATLEDPPAAMPLPAGATLETESPGSSSSEYSEPTLAESILDPDREIKLTDHGAATKSGVQSVARGTRDAFKGMYELVKPPETVGEKSAALFGPLGLPIYRMLRGAGHTASDAMQIAGSIHDINNSDDPTGTYLKMLQEDAGQGAGQAIAGIATEGLARGLPKVVPGTVRLGARSAEAALNQKLVPLRKIANLNTPADAAEALDVKVPGRDFGLPKPKPKPGVAADLDATGENKPYAGSARPQSADLDATGENKPFAGGTDEPTPQGELDATGENKPYAGSARPQSEDLDATGENKPFAGGTDEPPAAKVPAETAPEPAAKPAAAQPSPKATARPARAAKAAKRTIVTDPETGKPEFSDVVEAKQSTAAKQTAVVTAEPAAETSAPAAAAAPEPAAEVPEALKGTHFEPGKITPEGQAYMDRLNKIADEIRAEEARHASNAQVPEPGQDLESLLKQSLDPEFLSRLRARKAAVMSGTKPAAAAGEEIPRGGVFTSAVPKTLLDRWGVDPESFTEGRSQTRGMTADQSAAAIDDLVKAYKKGKPVEPVLETRDAANNIVDVDGRSRALAAHKAGIERIPIIVRRLPATSPQ